MNNFAGIYVSATSFKIYHRFFDNSIFLIYILSVTYLTCIDHLREKLFPAAHSHHNFITYLASFDDMCRENYVLLWKAKSSPSLRIASKFAFSFIFGSVLSFHCWRNKGNDVVPNISNMIAIWINCTISILVNLVMSTRVSRLVIREHFFDR